jgi:defect in organelle trafficking protein DotD
MAVKKFAPFASVSPSLSRKRKESTMLTIVWGQCAVGLMALLAGCGGVTPVPPDVATTGMPNTELALQTSMADVHAAMGELDGMLVPGPAPEPAVVPGELDRPVSFAWSGLLDQGVRVLADRVGYRMTVTAPKDSKPLMVSVNLSNVTTIDAFRALGNAAGSSATVVVDPNHHLVEVEHHV